MTTEDRLTLEQIAALTNVMRVREQLAHQQQHLDKINTRLDGIVAASRWLIDDANVPDQHKPAIGEAMTLAETTLRALAFAFDLEVTMTKDILAEREAEADLLSPGEPDE